MKAKSQINLLLFSIGRVANRCPPTIQGVTLVSTVGWGRGSRTAAHLIRFKLYCTFFFCLLSSASWLVDLRFNLALNHSLRDKQAAVLVTADAQHSGTKQTAQRTVRQTVGQIARQEIQFLLATTIMFCSRFVNSLCTFCFFSFSVFFLLSFYVHANWIAVTTGAISIFIEFSLNFQ